MAGLNGTGSVSVSTPGILVDSPGGIGPQSTCSPVTEFLGVTAATTLTDPLTATGSQTTLTVASTLGITVGTSTPNYLQIDSEIMQITAVQPPLTVTVNRGALGTTTAPHTSGAPVQAILDRLFLFVAAFGRTGSACMSNCLYNFDVTVPSTTPPNPTAGLRLANTGTSSGIIVDNQSTTQVGAQQIYFSWSAISMTVYIGTNSGAFQVSQSNLQ